jgi:hypothetical protein
MHSNSIPKTIFHYHINGKYVWLLLNNDGLRIHLYILNKYFIQCTCIENDDAAADDDDDKKIEAVKCSNIKKNVLHIVS